MFGLGKYNDLAFTFVRGLSNEQRKQLHVLTNHISGVDALEDEIPGALHDQAHDGDEEAWEVLKWEKETINNILERGIDTTPLCGECGNELES